MMTSLFFQILKIDLLIDVMLTRKITLLAQEERKYEEQTLETCLIPTFANKP